MTEKLNALALLERQDTPEAKAVFDYVNAIKQKNIAVLGESEIFVLRDNSGQIKAFKGSLTLSLRNRGLWKDRRGQLIISAQGYEKWATATGASVIFPKKIAIGNELFPNPHPTYGQDGRIVGVFVRAFAFSYSPLGIPQVSDWSHFYDPPAYKMIDLFAKAKKFPQSFKLLPKGMEPKTEKDETWAGYPVDEIVTFWVDTSHPEVFDWYSQARGREKKAVDAAQTFVKRNALKHLSGLQEAPYDNWTIPILAWRPTGNNIIKWDGTKYAELQDRVTNMVDGGSQDFQGQRIEYIKGHSDGSDDEFREEIEAEIDPEDSPESEEKDQSLPPQPIEKKTDENPVELSKDVKQAIYLSKHLPEIFDEALSILGIDRAIPVEDYDDTTAIGICRKVSEIVDTQN